MAEFASLEPLLPPMVPAFLLLLLLAMDVVQCVVLSLLLLSHSHHQSSSSLFLPYFRECFVLVNLVVVVVVHYVIDLFLFSIVRPSSSRPTSRSASFVASSRVRL